MKIKIILASVILLWLTACGHVAYVYSGVDPAESLSKIDPIVFMLPDNPSIRERNMAAAIRNELIKNGFHIVQNYQESKWTLSFALDRKTYTIGSSTFGSAVGFGSFGVPMAIGSSTTKYTQQTDVTLYMHLLRTSDFDKTKPLAIWEGSVTTKDKVFAELPNTTIKNLLDQFGKNFERRVKLDRAYQREPN